MCSIVYRIGVIRSVRCEPSARSCARVVPRVYLDSLDGWVLLVYG